MNRKAIVIVSACVTLLFLLGFFIYIFQDSSENNLITYPLDMIDVDDDSEYMVIITGQGQTCDVTKDTQSIKENRDLFSVTNNDKIYDITPDGYVELYKDRKLISSLPVHSRYTQEIEYGTLQFQQENQLQYLLLTGARVLEQGKHHSLLAIGSYFYLFAHGEDLSSLNTVYFIDYAETKIELPVVEELNNDVIEFIKYSLENKDLTKHWFLRKSNSALSPSYWNVKARKDNLILYPANEQNGGSSRIIIHDMFNMSVDYHEITGEFPNPRNIDFLLSAHFNADGSISAKYTGTDGEEHEETFVIP